MHDIVGRKGQPQSKRLKLVVAVNVTPLGIATLIVGFQTSENERIGCFEEFSSAKQVAGTKVVGTFPFRGLIPLKRAGQLDTVVGLRLRSSARELKDGDR